MEVIIDSKLYQQALAYAQQQGLNLTSVIENFLVRFIGSSKNATEQAVPDIVLSLLGAGESVADEDINAREAKDVFARFSSDWGGDMSTEDYADMLRSENVEDARTVETW